MYRSFRELSLLSSSASWYVFTLSRIFTVASFRVTLRVHIFANSFYFPLIANSHHCSLSRPNMYQAFRNLPIMVAFRGLSLLWLFVNPQYCLSQVFILGFPPCHFIIVPFCKMFPMYLFASPILIIVPSRIPSLLPRRKISRMPLLAILNTIPLRVPISI